MATPKNWIANDIKMDVMRLNLIGSNLSLIQGYNFIDSNGDELTELPAKTVSELTVFADLPQNIRTALITLRTYLYNKALIQEGMEDIE